MDESLNPGGDEASIPETAQFAQWQAEAAEAVNEPDLRERVRDLTARALHERRMAFADLRAIVSAIVSGVGDGLSGRGDEMRAHLKEAVGGLDEAVGSAAQTVSYTLQEAAEAGRALKDNELKASLEQLRDLEGQLVDTLKDAGERSGGKFKEELGYLSDHLRHSGTRTGEQARGALERLARGLKAGGAAGRAGLSESAHVATDHLAQVASGILEALADSLKRQSERLRS